MIDREELERLHEAAIPGPWRAEKIKGHADFTQILHTKKDGKIGCVSADINDADGELTAHLRNAVPDILTLLTERDTLAAENAALTAKVERLMNSLEPFAQLSRRKANFVIRPDDPILLEAVRALES